MKFKYLKSNILLVALYSLLLCQLEAKIKYVTIESEGTGVTVLMAINNALVNAIGQVNGTEISAKTALHSIEISNGDETKSLEAYQQNINKNTKGVIKEYRIVNKEKSITVNNLWTVKVQATISKYSASKQSQRLRMAVVPFTIDDKIPKWKNPDEFRKDITDSLINYLSQTRKFAILDRENLKHINNELSMLKKGSTPTEELAKLGQRLSTDYLVIGNIDKIHYFKNTKTLKVSGKKLTTVKQGARITYRILDVATGQIKLSDSFDRILSSGNNKISSSNLARKTSVNIGQIILNAIYPIRVEAYKGNDLFIGQGGKTLNKGDKYSLVMLGESLIDSVTGESLGRQETDVGTVKIIRVQAKQSVANILHSTVNVTNLFKPGLFIIRPKKNTSKKINFKKKEKSAKRKIEKLEKSVSEDW